MNPVQMMRLLVAEALGTRGAVVNCRAELHRREAADLAVERLCARLPLPAEAHEAPAASA